MKNIVDKIIIEILELSGKSIPTDPITSNKRLREDLGFDSFNLAELTVHLEEQFNIDVFENGVVNTVGEIYQRLNIED